MRRILLAATIVVLLAAGGGMASARPAFDDPAGGGNDLWVVRGATNRYHDLLRAMDDGYGLLVDAKGVACIAIPGEGGMGVHFANTKLVADPTERLARPEALVYRMDDRGRLHLAALEYVVIASDWDAHHSAPPKLFGHQFSLTPAGNRYGLPAFYSLHAWVWD